MIQRRCGTGNINTLPQQIGVSSDVCIQAKQGARNFTAAGTDQSGKAEDFTLVKRKVNVFKITRT